MQNTRIWLTSFSISSSQKLGSEYWPVNYGNHEVDNVTRKVDNVNYEVDNVNRKIDNVNYEVDFVNSKVDLINHEVDYVNQEDDYVFHEVYKLMSPSSSVLTSAAAELAQ